jgi:branched-chain amino acid transport system substrate-binding protein
MWPPRQATPQAGYALTGAVPCPYRNGPETEKRLIWGDRIPFVVNVQIGDSAALEHAYGRTLGLRMWTVCLAMLCAVGCRMQPTSPRAGNPNVIKIVSSLPRTGSANQQTTPMVQAIRMALDEAHFRAGAYTIVYEDWDDASTKKGDWDPEVESANASRAAVDPDVMAYLGPYNSGAAKIAMPLLNQAGLAMLSVATYPGLTKVGGGEANEPGVYRPRGLVNFFRINPADDIQGDLAAEWIARMHGQTAYVLDDQGLYGRGLADVFVNAAEDHNIRILGRDAIDPRAQEYRSLMTRIKTLQPEWVYFGGTTQTNAGQVAKDLVAAGLTAKMIVPDAAMDQAFVQAADASHVNGRVYATFGGLPPEEMRGKAGAFVEAYRARWGSVPESFAIYAYSQTKAVLGAIEACGAKDRGKIREALLHYHEDDGILGKWQMTPSGDSDLRTMSGNRVEGGRFVYVTQLGHPTP